MRQCGARDSPPLPRNCSAHAEPELVDRPLFEGSATSVGEFRCPVEHPSFRNSGPAERCLVVFPRTAVWIHHDGSRPFVADPNVITIYNRAQCYERAPLAPEGDRCDWFGVSDQLARQIVQAIDPVDGERARGPYRFEHAPSTPRLYLEQRHLVRRVVQGALQSVEIESAIVDLVTKALGQAYGRQLQPSVEGVIARRRQREVVEAAKGELVRSLTENRSMLDIARSVGTSVFHLCRIFRACTNQTMHAYRTDLRLRSALERLAEGSGTLASIAADFGFSSHAHLVLLCQRRFGAPPSLLRSQLRSMSARHALTT